MTCDYTATKHTVVDWLHPVLKKVKQRNKISQSKEIEFIARTCEDSEKYILIPTKFNTKAAEPQSSILLTSQPANGHNSKK